VRSPQRVQYSGLVVALSGFGITRLFVAETARVDAAVPFLLAGVLPLVAGLALTVYGVALAIGPFSEEYVDTIARWHVLGVGGMVVVFAVTAADQFVRSGGVGFLYQAPLLVGNVLLGGAVGGTLTGVRSGRMVRQRQEIRRSANRALLVNRLLKHEVLNAITIIDGHADLLDETSGGRSESLGAIRRAVTRIKSTIGEIGTIARDGRATRRLDFEEVVRREIDGIEAASDVDVELSVLTEDAAIDADDRLALVVRELLENAVGHGGTDVSVELGGSPHTVRLSIADDGPGLPEGQRALLEDGAFPEYDDPATGFGNQIARLFVVQFGGTIRVREGREATPAGDDGGTGGDTGAGTGTEITVLLPRSERRGVSVETVGLSVRNLTQAIVGGLLGGLAMGAFVQLTTGLLPVIGSLYGLQNPLIGWITHLFHSAVFGLLFAAIATEPRMDRFARGPLRSGLLGLGWGTVLWFVAAGIVMPAWLSLVGIPAAIPNFSPTGFVGHALWGTVLGVTYRELGTLDVVERL
jgi:signal transduction histidine kinase